MRLAADAVSYIFHMPGPIPLVFSMIDSNSVRK